jgi:predicted small secreted protein
MKDRIWNFIAVNSPAIGLALVIAVVLLMLSGCNTVAGMGTDITKGANWTAEKNQWFKTRIAKV